MRYLTPAAQMIDDAYTIVLASRAEGKTLADRLNPSVDRLLDLLSAKDADPDEDVDEPHADAGGVEDEFADDTDDGWVEPDPVEPEQDAVVFNDDLEDRGQGSPPLPP